MCSSQPRLRPSFSFSSGQTSVHDRARDLVAVPGDPPQARVEVRHREPAARSPPRSARAASQWSRNASVSASQIRRWSASTTGRISRPVGQRRVRDRLGQGADHHEAVADAPVALGLEQREPAGAVRVDPRAQLVRLGARPRRRDLARPSLGPAGERPADAPPPRRPDGPSRRSEWTRDPVPDHDVRLDLADEPAVELGDEHVATEVEVRLVGRGRGGPRRR